MTSTYDTASALQAAIRSSNPDFTVHERVQTGTMIAHLARYIDDTYHDPADGLLAFAKLLVEAADLRGAR